MLVFFHAGHDIDKDLKVVILQKLENGNSQALNYFEDRWMCTLQSLSPDGINRDTNGYAKEMYTCFKRIICNQKLQQ